MHKSTKKHGVLRFTAAAIVFAGLFVSAQASATLINFENAGYLGDNTAISPTLQFPLGAPGANVTFVGGSNPTSQTNTGIYLEHSGNGVSDANGFLNTHNGNGTNQVDNHDTARPCFPSGCGAHPYPAGEPGLGNWFLRTDGLGSNTLGTGDTFLTINYGTPTFGASGQIWILMPTATVTNNGPYTRTAAPTRHQSLSTSVLKAWRRAMQIRSTGYLGIFR